MTPQNIAATTEAALVVPVQPAQRPVQKSERISTIDTIRGVALFGILLMNIPGFGFHTLSFYNLIKVAPHNTVDFYTFEVIEVFFEGTMRGLFSMLFGAGMLLFLMNKKESGIGPTTTELYYRRLLLLVGFGLINAFVLLWRGDILFFYGLGGMLLFPFRKMSAKWLVVAGLVFFSMAAVKTQWNHLDLRSQRKAYLEAVAVEKSGKKLTPEQTAAKSAWEQRANWKPDEAEGNRNIANMRSGYGTVFATLLPDNANGEIWGMYHWAVWDCVGMMLIGMALFKLGYFSNKPRTSTYVMGLVVGYGIGLPIGYFMFTLGFIPSIMNLGNYVDAYTMPHSVLYDLKRLFLSLGHASLVMLVFRSKVVPWLMKGLANVGQMAFTNYLMQSIICTLIFHGYGLGLYNKLAFHQLYYIVFGVWVAQLIFSAIWLRYYRFGPFEWAWRSMTYWKKQPFKLKEPVPAG